MKRILTIIAGILIIAVALVGNYLMYKHELSTIEKEYNTKLESMEKDMQDVYNKDLTIQSMTDMEDANNIYNICEKFITSFHSIDVNNDWNEIEAILKKCMTEDAYNEYTPLASGSRGENNPDEEYTITVSDIEVYLNYQNYTGNQVSATVLYTKKMDTKNIDGEKQPYIWKGTFIKEKGEWKVSQIELDSYLDI